MLFYKINIFYLIIISHKIVIFFFESFDKKNMCKIAINYINNWNTKILKNIRIKIEVEKKTEKRGDTIYKISNQIIVEKRKKFSILIRIDNFSTKIII